MIRPTLMHGKPMETYQWKSVPPLKKKTAGKSASPSASISWTWREELRVDQLLMFGMVIPPEKMGSTGMSMVLSN